MAHKATVTVTSIETGEDPSLTAIRMLVAARRAAWEQQAARGPCFGKEPSLIALALTHGPEVAGSDSWRLVRGEWVVCGGDDAAGGPPMWRGASGVPI